MNKNNYTYKKLGEICEIERGGSPRPISEYITTASNGINWIKIGDAEDNSKFITSTKEKIKPEGMKKSRFVHKGDFLLSNSMSFGRPYILAVDGCIHDGWLVLHDTQNVFSKDYLYYYLGSPQTYEVFKTMAVGGVVNNLNSEMVRNLLVPVPPLATQRKIVEELDCLNNIIAKKRLQLQDYDRLAQALFHQTFGDPVDNDMGWEVKKWQDVITIINGKNQKKVETPNGKYPICGSGGIMGYANKFLCPENSIIIGRKGNINRPIYMSEKFWNVDTAFGLVANHNYLMPQFLYFFCIFYNFEQHNKAVTIPSLTKMDLLKISIPVPPLALQQQFAAKIEAIEAQKARIRQSVAEVQTLLNYTMDKYFG